MKEIFNFSRFGKYLAYDLRRATNNYGLSLLILGFLPVFCFVAYGLLHKLTMGEWGTVDSVMQYVMLIIAYITMFFSFPAKVYGHITEKRAGSDYIMLPASALEKWLSMILVTCVVLPLCAGVLFFGSDAILSLLAEGYGQPIFSALAKIRPMILDNTSGLLDINIPAVIYMDWCSTFLFFTLGAIFFKKAKAAKTLLALMGISFASSIITMAIFGTAHLDLENWINRAETMTEEEAVRLIMSYFYGIVIAYFVLILGGLFARIKTIKH